MMRSRTTAISARRFHASVATIKASGTATASATSSWRNAASLRVAATSPFHELIVARNHRPIGSSSTRRPSHSVDGFGFRTLRYRVFGGLDGARPDDLAGRLRLEHRRFLGKRIDAFSRLCGGLLDDNEFGEPGHEEGARFLEFLVADLRQQLDDALDVLARHAGWVLLGDLLNEFRLRHQLSHVCSP